MPQPPMNSARSPPSAIIAMNPSRPSTDGPPAPPVRDLHPADWPKETQMPKEGTEPLRPADLSAPFPFFRPLSFLSAIPSALRFGVPLLVPDGRDSPLMLAAPISSVVAGTYHMSCR